MKTKLLLPLLLLMPLTSCVVTNDNGEAVDVTDYIFTKNSHVVSIEHDKDVFGDNVRYVLKIDLYQGDDLLSEESHIYELFDYGVSYSYSSPEYNFIKTKNLPKTLSNENVYFPLAPIIKGLDTSKITIELSIKGYVHSTGPRKPVINLCRSTIDLKDEPTIYDLNVKALKETFVNNRLIETNPLLIPEKCVKTFTHTIVGFHKTYKNTKTLLGVRFVENTTPIESMYFDDTSLLFSNRQNEKLGKDIYYVDLSLLLFKSFNVMQLSDFKSVLKRDIQVEVNTTALNGDVVSSWIGISQTGLYYVSLAKETGALPPLTCTEYKEVN